VTKNILAAEGKNKIWNIGYRIQNSEKDITSAFCCGRYQRQKNKFGFLNGSIGESMQASVNNSMPESESHYLTDVQTLPASARLVIYGTGGLASVLHQRLKAERPDVEVVVFLDSFRQGNYQGRPMLKPDAFFTDPPPIDLYVIASHLWANEIEATLNRYHAIPQVISMILPQRYSYLYLSAEQYRTEEKKIESLLATKKDQELWCIIMGCLRRKNPAAMMDWYQKNPGIPYMHQVSLKEGDVVIEGGVFDGSNSREFSRRIGKGGRIYGFDPNGDDFVRARNRHGAPTENVEIIRKALWSHSQNIYVQKIGAGTRVSEQKGDSVDEIVAITIDDFVAERNLRKIDLIKMDVEGAEQAALVGGMTSIQRLRPQLAISIYHSVEDLFQIPLQLSKHLRNYNFYLFAYSPSLGDIVLFAVPQERAAD